MKRVKYEKNPIYEAILQIKYPPILAINAKDPVEFQESIRKQFPIYQLQISNQQELTLTPVGNNTIPAITQKVQTKNHIFVDRGGNNKIVLSQESISISTMDYTVWEDLIALFNPVLKSFEDIYSPSFYSRIGLRYTDVFSKEKLGLTQKPWKELINSPYSGAFSLTSEENVINNISDYSWKLNDNKSIVRVRTGLAKTDNSSSISFVIDSDFSRTENIEVVDFESVVNYLHNEAGKFISQTISQELKEAMKPEVIGEYE